MDFARNRPLKGGHIYDPTEDPHAYASTGYVFGQSMSPKTILDALQYSAQSVEPEQRQHITNGPLKSFKRPFLLSQACTWFISVYRLGLWSFVEEDGCVGSAIAIILSSIPSCFVEFNMRFLIPSTAVGALLLVGPIAAIASAVPRFGISCRRGHGTRRVVHDPFL